MTHFLRLKRNDSQLCRCMIVTGLIYREPRPSRFFFASENVSYSFGTIDSSRLVSFLFASIFVYLFFLFAIDAFSF